MEKEAKSLKQLAQDAIDVQDACNLSGVVYGFARAMESLCEHVSSSAERNTHPVAVLWASKIASLTRCESDLSMGRSVFSCAYNACADLVGGK